MKISTPTESSLQHLRKLIEPMKVAMLTTLDAEGALSSRPMAPLEMDVDGALWFFTDLRSAKIKDLDPVNLSFSESTQGTYVSLSGRGHVDTDHARIERLWTPMARPWFPEGTESTHLALLKVVPFEAEYWDAPNSKMVRLLAMAASVVAGKPLGLGTHDVITELAARD